MTVSPKAVSLRPNGSDVGIDATAAVTFVWEPLWPQYQYQIRYRKVGDSWPGSPQVSHTGDVSSHEFPASTFTVGEAYEWQVRADSSYPYTTYGPWSDTATFVASAAPTITIDSPSAGSYGFSSVTLEWSDSSLDNEPLVGDAFVYLIKTLGSPGEPASEGTFVDAQAGTYTFDMPVENDCSYKLGISAHNRFGIYGEATITLDVAYYLPAPVTISATRGQIVSYVSVYPVSSPPANSVPIDHVDIERRISSNGEWEMFATNLTPAGGFGGAVLDARPALHDTTYYRATVYSAIPSIRMASTELAPPERVTECVLQVPAKSGEAPYGQSFSKGVAVSPSYERSASLHHFAGRAKPVALIGEDTTLTLNIKAIVTNFADVLALRAMIDTGRILLWRDALRYVFGVVSGFTADPLANAGDPNVHTISFTLTETDRG